MRRTSDNMDIWHIDNNTWTKLILWRTDKNIFRVTQSGEFKPLLTNANYFLVDKKFVPILKDLAGQVSFEDVQITDPTSNFTKDNYVELQVKNRIDPSTIHSLDGKGLRIWRHNAYIFVSTELKIKLTEIDADNLKFTLGFSHFGR